MKRGLCCVLVVLFLVTGGLLWALENDVKDMPSCKYCGMNRETFSHSRMVIDYGGGDKVGLCSIHCASIDLALNLDKAPVDMQVADYDTKAMINPEMAVWVIGGNKPGVMTKNAKWAFSSRAGAEKFVKENGGRIANFDEALQATYQDLGNDTKMIREKRRMTKMKSMEHGH